MKTRLAAFTMLVVGLVALSVGQTRSWAYDDPECKSLTESKIDDCDANGAYPDVTKDGTTGVAECPDDPNIFNKCKASSWYVVERARFRCIGYTDKLFDTDCVDKMNGDTPEKAKCATKYECKMVFDEFGVGKCKKTNTPGEVIMRPVRTELACVKSKIE